MKRPSKLAAFSADTSGPLNSTVTFSGGGCPGYGLAPSAEEHFAQETAKCCGR
jgi:hypothetical protein